MIEMIQPKSEKDLEGVANVSFCVDGETMSRFWTEETLYAYRKHGWQDALAAARSFSEFIVAAKDGDTVAGMIVCSAAYANFEGEPLISNSALVNNVYVLPEFRGRGIGRQLLDAARERLKEYSAVTLYVYEDNYSAKYFYLHYGFRFDGVSFPDGKIYRGRFERMVLTGLS